MGRTAETAEKRELRDVVQPTPGQASDADSHAQRRDVEFRSDGIRENRAFRRETLDSSEIEGLFGTLFVSGGQMVDCADQRRFEPHMLRFESVQRRDP